MSIFTNRTDVIPGRTIVQSDLEQIQEVETYLAAMHRKSALIDVGMRASQQNAAAKQADAMVLVGMFSYGSPVFDKAIQRVTILPFLLYVNLKVTPPSITFEETKELLSGLTEGKGIKHPKFWEIRGVLLNAWGFQRVTKTIPASDEAASSLAAT